MDDIIKHYFLAFSSRLHLPLYQGIFPYFGRSLLGYHSLCAFSQSLTKMILFVEPKIEVRITRGRPRHQKDPPCLHLYAFDMSAGGPGKQAGFKTQ